MMTDSTTSARTTPRWAKFLIDLFAAGIVLALGVWAATGSFRQARVVSDTHFPAPRAMEPCILKGPGYLNGRLYGALDLYIDWRGTKMECDGMMRPNDDGIRLVFASTGTTDDSRLIFVMGIDGTIDKLANVEAKVNITIIDESTGSFFSTGGQDRCWTTVRSIEPLKSIVGQQYQVDGDLYCAGAVPSLTDQGSVTLGDFHFSGRLSLDDS